MKRPITVTILSLILIAAGAVGLVYHAREFRSLHPFPTGLALIAALRLLAIVAGIFMMRGVNWARWLAIFWIALHVIVSYFHSWDEVIMHAVILAIFVILLFRKNAAEFFHGAPV